LDTFLDLISLVFGGLVLYFGADWLVKGSAGLARAFGVKPLVVGLTVVAYGTSTPELAVSTAAILEGSSPLVLGNIIGSNIANLALILGLTALIAPPSVDGQLIRREVPVMCLACLAVPLVLLDGAVSTIEAGVLVGAAVAFTLYTLLAAIPQAGGPGGAELELAEAMASKRANEHSRLRLTFMAVAGTGLLIGGGELFVHGAQSLAHGLGMSERVVGLTVVAVGTAMPELAASLIAAVRGYSALALGNIVGANIFNIFMILGAVGLIRPIQGNLSGLATELAFLGGVTILGVLFMRGTRKIHRVEGALLLAAYAAFLGFVLVSR
jgi:cation:H+ antiporter